MTNLDAHRRDITAALDGLSQLSATLRARDRQIGNVLDNLTPGLRVLASQRGQLVTLLNSLHALSGVAVDTISKSKADMVASLRALAPILRELADAGQALPQSLQVLLTYPFTDRVLKAIKGDYLNTYLSVTAAPGTTIIPPVSPKPRGGAGRGQAMLPLPAVGATARPAASPSRPPGGGPGGGG